MSDRDRDADGRAQNARPRDATGRPLPHGTAGVPRPPEVERGPEEALQEAQRLLDSDQPFHAHEVFEGVWKATGSGDRDLWKGLAQLAVGLTHVQRANPRGAVALLRRGIERVEPYTAAAPYGLDLDGVTRDARALAQRIEEDGLEALGPADLRLKLRTATSAEA